MPHTLVAVDEGMALNQREAQRSRLLDQRGIQVDPAEGGLGLRDCRLEAAQIANPDGAAGCAENEAVEFNHLAQRQMAHQARRRYSSAFFRSTRSAAARKSSSRVPSRSASAA